MKLNDITYRINGAIFEVHKILGPGFFEKVYEKALIIEMKQIGLKAVSQPPIQVNYKGEIVGEYFPDILVEDQVIVELKAVEQIGKIHEAQVLNYLKATGLPIAILANFKSLKAQVKRFVSESFRSDFT
jgi:GxxExxY protein